jgi:signal transduction histidine kinase
MQRTSNGVRQEPAEQTQFRHDLKQYLAAGLLLAQMPGDELLDEPMQQRLETIRQLLRHMMDMVGEDAGRPKLQTWPVDLVEMVNDCVKVVQLTSKVTVLTEQMTPTTAYGDPVMLRRAIGNVLDNASRAAGRNGSVLVRVGQKVGESCVEIADDGLGFGRIPTVHGHGMSVVDQALRACHGRLEITSGPGPGTSVRLLIPTQREGDS